VTAEHENQLSWRGVVGGESWPSQDVFDEGRLLNSRISDTDVVCCNSGQIEHLGPANSILAFSAFPNPAMSILILLVPRRSAPELEQRWDDDVGSFIVSVGFLRDSADIVSVCFIRIGGH
jgi:hypothetical protein